MAAMLLKVFQKFQAANEVRRQGILEEISQGTYIYIHAQPMNTDNNLRKAWVEELSGTG